MTKGEALRDRTVAMIIDSAADLLAKRGMAASMDDIAAAAGIGRATLYRYFASREDLLEAMALAGVGELAAQIKAAALDTVPFDEAIARLARAIIATGSKYMVLSRDGARHTNSYPNIDAEVMEPLRALFRRAVADGLVQDSFSPDLLVSLFSGLIRGALDETGSRQRGVEETAAAVTNLFLGGIREGTRRTP